MINAYDVYKKLIERDGLVCGICKKPLEKEYLAYLQWYSRFLKRKERTISREVYLKKAEVVSV